MLGPLVLIALLQVDAGGALSVDAVATLPVVDTPEWANTLIRLEAQPASNALPTGTSDVGPFSPTQLKLEVPAPRDSGATHVSLLGLTQTPGIEYRPLTGHERWELFWNETVSSPGAYGPVVVTSIWNQITKTPPEWGSGASGLGWRAASAFGTNVVQGVIQSAGCALLKQDPRFIRIGEGGFWRRARHAVLFTALTYDDHGRTTFATGNVASFYGSDIVTILWYPPGHHALSEGLKAANFQMAMNAVFNLFQEFWPDIKRKFKRTPA
jgi:hypothetical protein